MKEIPDILREMRTDRDLKQSEIAEILGTSQQYYSKYETGKFEIPLRFLVALADYYGVSADFLLGRSESREGLEAMKRAVTPNCSGGYLLSNVLSLSPAGRKAVVEYVELQRIKEKLKKS